MFHRKVAAVIVGMLIVAGMASEASAADTTKVYGFQDYRGTLSPNTDGSSKKITITTSCCDVGIGPLSAHIDVFTDRITFEIKSTVMLAAIGFVNSGVGDGKNEVTVVYGVDMNPTGALGPMTGFDPTNPQVSLVNNEVLVSRAGKRYSASTSIDTIENLKKRFPKYDFNANFYEASPFSLVVIATAIVPNVEFNPFYATP